MRGLNTIRDALSTRNVQHDKHALWLSALMDVKKEIGRRIREGRKAKGLTQGDLAELAGWAGQSRISMYERGEREPEMADLRALRQHIEFDFADVIHAGVANTGVGPDRGGRVPLISWVQAGAFATVVDNLHPGDAEEWIETTVPVHQHTYALRVYGDWMTNPAGDPTFPEGSIIVVEPDAIGSAAEMVGRFVIVKRNGDGEATFKQLVKDGGELFLRPLNPQYPMLKLRETDQICGVVREKVMRFF